MPLDQDTLAALDHFAALPMPDPEPSQELQALQYFSNWQPRHEQVAAGRKVLDQLPRDAQRLVAQGEATLALEGLPSATRNAVVPLIGAGADVTSPLLRPFDSQSADYVNWMADQANQIANEEDKNNLVVPPVIARGLRGAARTLPVTGLATQALGPYGGIAAGAVTEGNQALTEGRDAGLEGLALARYAGEQALIEGSIAATFQQLGMGGLESTLASKHASAGVTDALKQLGKSTLQEVPEELLTEFGHNYARQLEGVDPNALSPDALRQTATDTFVQTVLTMGLAEAPNIASAAARDVREIRNQILSAGRDPAAVGIDAEELQRQAGQGPLPPELLARFDQIQAAQSKAAQPEVAQQQPTSAAPDVAETPQPSTTPSTPTIQTPQNTLTQKPPQPVTQPDPLPPQPAAEVDPTGVEFVEPAPDWFTAIPPEQRGTNSNYPDVPGLPPVRQGHVRFYHGHSQGDANFDYDAWLTPDPRYAQGYANKGEGGQVAYVDIPLDHPALAKSLDEINNYWTSWQAPRDISRKLQNVPTGQTPDTPAPTNVAEPPVSAPIGTQPDTFVFPDASTETEDEFRARAIDSDQSRAIIHRLRAGDARSKNRGDLGDIREELQTGPLVPTALPLSVFGSDYLQHLRESTSQERVKRYASENVRTPIYALPPKQNPGRFGRSRWIVSDGGHRVLAALARGETSIPALVPADAYRAIQPTEKPNVPPPVPAPPTPVQGPPAAPGPATPPAPEGADAPIDNLSQPQRKDPTKLSEAAERDYGTVDAPNRTALGEHFGDRLASGASYPSINEARQEAADLLKGPVRPGTPTAKHVDEAVEQGVVRSARQVVSQSASPEAAFDGLVDLYNRQPNLGVRTSTSISQQAYSTPAPLAYLASQLAGITPQSTVYEPTAGNGMLLIGADPARAVANELNPDRATALEAMGFIASRDDATEPNPSAVKVDAVIANPPFGKVQDDSGNDKSWTIDGVKTNQVDHAISLNALGTMRDGGRAVLILGAKGGRESDPVKRARAYSGSGKTFYDRIYDTYNVVDHFTVSGDLYRRQGAGFPVDVIVIEGRGTSTRPRPWNVKQNGVPQVYESWEDLKRDKLATQQRPESVGARAPVLGSTDSAGGQKPDVAGVPVEDAGPPAVDAATDGGSGGRSTGGVRSPVAVDDGQSSAVPAKQPGKRGGGGRVPRSPASQGDQSAAVPDQTRPARPRPSGVDQGDVVDRRPVDGPAPERVPGLEPEVDEKPQKSPIDNLSIESKPKRAESKESQTEFQASYQPQSAQESVDTLLPRNHVDAVRRGLEAVVEEHGDIDQFVAKELGFTKKQMEGAFSAEQVDALALAIANHKRGEGFILGDQTGVGKGRVAAGMIQYAKRQGLLPVFVTEKPDLFGDMVRDLSDSGLNTSSKPFNPLATNNLGGTDTLVLPDGRVITQGAAVAKRLVTEAIDNWVAGRGLKASKNRKSIDFDAVFTTYSQLQSVEGKEPWRRDVLRKAQKNAFFILDESHNAGGTKNERGSKDDDTAVGRAEFIRELIKDAPGVYYSSATFAKRPEVMDLYARAGMGRAVKDPAELPAAIDAGGVPLQQVVSEMLAESGQYLRRERSFDGVEFNPKVVPVDLKIADDVSAVFRAVMAFSDSKEDAVAQLEEDVVSQGGVTVRDDSTGQAGVESMNFTSILWNIVDQQLISLKAEQVAEEAIASWKAGETPVIAVDQTMETALGYYLEKNPSKPGDPIQFTFSALLDRYLERTREVTVKPDREDPSQNYTHYLTDAELGPAAVQFYNEAKEMIRAFKAEIPASPIDWIRHKLEKAGMKVAEITGRKLGMKYEGTTQEGVLWARPESEVGTAGKVRTIRDFNSGKLDAVILNRSGATGVSLHASEKFANKRRRNMIIAQAAKNIDEFMQVLGRVNRTGQVSKPKYTLLMSDAPAENRPASVLMKKLASLNANVTGAAKGAVGFDAPDVLNKVGDQVVADMLTMHLSMHEDIGSPLELNSKTGALRSAEDAARKVTGRIALLPVEKQEQFWDEVTQMYTQRIEELDALGENPLQARTLPMEAKTLERFTLFDGVEDSSNPFEQPAYLEKVSAKKIGKAFASAEVKQRVEDFYGQPGKYLPTLQSEWSRKFRSDLKERTLEYAKAKIAEAKTDAMKAQLQDQFNQQFSSVVDTAAAFSPGTPVVVKALLGDLTGVVIGFKQTGKAKNPSAPSSWVAEIAVADAIRKLSVPVSRLASGESNVTSTPGDLRYILPEFDEANTTTREERYVATGNLLAAYTQLKDPNAQITFFTDEQKQVRRGILMPAKFDPEKWKEARPVVFEKPEHVSSFLDQGGLLYSPDKTVWVATAGSQLVIKTAKSKAKGGRYFLNKGLLAAAGTSEFNSKGSYMELLVSPANRKAVLAKLLELTPLQAENDKQRARQITGQAEQLRKQADVAEQKGPRKQSLGFFGGSSERVRDDRIAPEEVKAPREEVERQLQASYGMKPDSLLQQIKEFGKTALAAATRAQQHISPVAANATKNEMFRLHKQLAATAQDEANRSIAAVVDPLGPQTLQLFTRKVVIDNLLAAVDRGEPLRFGFDSRQEVAEYKQQLDELVDKTPVVKESLDRRRAVVGELVNDLVDMGLLSEVARDRADTYYHQQVLNYLSVSRMGRNPQITKKGFQRRRVAGVEQFDESLNYNTSYLEAEFEWMRDAYHQIAKEQWIRDLGERFDEKKQLQEVARASGVDWRDLVRDSGTHRIWQATPGNAFYQATGVAERVTEEVLVNGSAEIMADDLRKMLAIGGPQREMVLPNDLADQLDSMQAPRKGGDKFGEAIATLSRNILGSWKTWTLFNPLRAFSYNLRNLAGDSDVVIGGALGSVAYANRSIRELAGYFGIAGKPELSLSPELKAARDLGVIDASLTANEIPDLKDLEIFRRFYAADKAGLAKMAKGYFDTIRRYSAFRESISRYAAFLYYKQALKKGNLAHYGGARKSVVDKLAADMGVDVAAAHLSRNLLGDYGDLTVLGTFLRQHIIPFYSWQEVNTKRAPMLFANAIMYGARKSKDNPAAAAALSSGAVGMLLLPYIALQLFNHLMWPDEEDELADDDRANPHLIWGRNEDGSIRIMRNVGSLGDFLGTFGINTMIARLDELNAGQIAYSALAAEVMRDMANKQWQGLRPDAKALVELPMGRSTYPNVFNPRLDRRDDMAAGYLGLRDPYRQLRGTISRDGTRARPHFEQRLIGVTDPGREAFYEIAELRDRYLDKLGEAGSYKANPYFSNMREAVAANDFEAYKEARLAWIEKGGGDYTKFVQRLKAEDPLSRIPLGKRDDFVDNYLTDAQREKLTRAARFSTMSRDRMWQMWAGAEKHDPPELAEKLKQQRTAEAAKLAAKVHDQRVERLTTKEKEKGLTMEAKRKAWKDAQTKAIQAINDSGLSREEVLQAVRDKAKQELQSPEARAERMRRFRSRMGWISG